MIPSKSKVIKARDRVDRKRWDVRIEDLAGKIFFIFGNRPDGKREVVSLRVTYKKGNIERNVKMMLYECYDDNSVILM